MFSGQTLVDLNNDIAAQAAQKGLYPYTPWDIDELDEGAQWLRLIPNIGYLQLAEWELVDTLQVDKTGLDKSGPAASAEEAVNWARQQIEDGKATGFAWVEEGQFQIHLGAFLEV